MRLDRRVFVTLTLALVGCAHERLVTDAPRAPAAVSARDWERNGPCAILGPNVHIHPLARAQGTGVYGGRHPTSGSTFFTTTPEACEAQQFKAGKRLAGYVEEMSLANDCTNYGGEVISRTPLPNLVALHTAKDNRTGFTFRTISPKACKAQGFTTVETSDYVNP